MGSCTSKPIDKEKSTTVAATSDRRRIHQGRIVQERNQSHEISESKPAGSRFKTAGSGANSQPSKVKDAGHRLGGAADTDESGTVNTGGSELDARAAMAKAAQERYAKQQQDLEASNRKLDAYKKTPRAEKNLA